MRNEKGQFIKGHVPVNGFKKGIIPWSKGKKLKPLSEERRKNISIKLKGRKFTEEHRRKISESRKGDKHPLWKGDNVGYKSLHEWMRTNHTIGDICEHCGKKSFLEWASKEGNYTRNLCDWLRLCRSCHKKYDDIIKNTTRN